MTPARLRLIAGAAVLIAGAIIVGLYVNGRGDHKPAQKVASARVSAAGRAAMRCDFGKGYTVARASFPMTNADIRRIAADVPADIRSDAKIALEGVQRSQAEKKSDALTSDAYNAAIQRISAYVALHCRRGTTTSLPTASSSTSTSSSSSVSSTTRRASTTTPGRPATTRPVTTTIGRTTTSTPRPTTSTAPTTSSSSTTTPGGGA
ncbi:MAG: hypothetical protein H0W70_03800 [Actinobacteria bacterium]|nr:hypothetical protein [Actinomycetota bacterium]